MFFFDKLRCVLYLYVNSIRCMYRKIILNFVEDESGLHHGCVMVNCNKLNLYLVDNNFVHFYGYLL